MFNPLIAAAMDVPATSKKKCLYIDATATLKYYSSVLLYTDLLQSKIVNVYIDAAAKSFIYFYVLFFF